MRGWGIAAALLVLVGTQETRSAATIEKLSRPEGDAQLAASPSRPGQVAVKRGKRKSALVGHNVTPTTETLGQGVVTAGNYAVAVGLTDSVFIATSPWIWGSYNTANIHLKWGHALDRRSRVGVFASYFQSYDSYPLTSGPAAGQMARTVNDRFGRPTTVTTRYYDSLRRYQWESSSLHALYSYEPAQFASLYFNLHYAYFWNDDYAYSIRMDPGKDEIRDQIDATMLAALRLGPLSGFRLLLEGGALGLNYLYPYLQVGSSLAYASDSWLFQVGASATMQFREAMYASGWSPGRHDTRLHYSLSAGQYYTGRYLQTAVHPEIQIQYFF